MFTVKQSTALIVPIFLHDVNGDAVTGLLDGGFTKRISKASGAFSALTITITEKENGWYDAAFTSAHTNTLGLLSVTFIHASAKQVNLQFRVEAKLNDTLQDITPAQVNTEVDTGLTDYAGATTAQLNARTLLAADYFDPAVDAVANVTLVDTTTTNTDQRGTDSAATASALATAQLDLDKITGSDGATLAASQANYAPSKAGDSMGLTAGALNSVNAEVDTALNTAIPGAPTADSINERIVSVDDLVTSARMTELDAATTGKMANQVDLIKTDTSTNLPALIDDLAIKKNIAGLLHIEMVLASDSKTPAVGLTVTAQRLIDGAGAYANVTGTITEISNGTYRFDYLSADANGDIISWKFSGALADDTKLTFKTVA